MKLSTLLLSLYPLLLAFPQQTSTAISPISTSIGPRYRLRTHLKPRSRSNPHPHHRLNGLYLYTSPSDSVIGRNYPLFTSNISLAAYAFLNGTNINNTIQQFEIYNTTRPFSTRFSLQPDYGWAEVNIYPGFSETNGFEFVNEGRLGKALAMSNSTIYGTMWGGWIVCDWAHGAPQLFWRQNNYVAPQPYPAPRNCADVHIIQVL
ncbi:hypothetical protein K432DRAFT_427293 [Lepidopterella palustris CBS 459.81]|uniref:DUF7907 domain-containing protein n=1 Tax=Lepidopterella palustris CBS 459.81 TaxID=1314670 RepID=A0A8E2E6S4_9PEZI|nr:hypothetical protein K432DRAFT_427293 [Lepidopterella palustris CBS 459.81]